MMKIISRLTHLAFLAEILCIFAFNDPQAAGAPGRFTLKAFNTLNNHLKMKVSENFSYKVCWSPM